MTSTSTVVLTSRSLAANVIQLCEDNSGNESKWNVVLKNNQDDIINCLGGLNNLFQLALCDQEYVEKFITNNKINKLRQILAKNNIVELKAPSHKIKYKPSIDETSTNCNDHDLPKDVQIAMDNMNEMVRITSKSSIAIDSEHDRDIPMDPIDSLSETDIENVLREMSCNANSNTNISSISQKPNAKKSDTTRSTRNTRAKTVGIGHKDMEKHAHVHIIIDPDLQSENNYNINNVHSINSKFNSNLKRKSRVSTSSMKGFYQTKVILHVDPTLNFWFKYLARSHAMLLFNDVLLNRPLLVVLLSLMMVLWIIATLIQLFTDLSMIYVTLWSINWFIIVVLSIFYCLSINYTMFSLIIQTFDFWFKMYNIVALNVALICLQIQSEKESYVGVLEWDIFDKILWILPLFGVFMKDAMTLDIKIKRAFNIMFTVWMLYIAIYSFFLIPDGYWNPFKSRGYKWTRISWKSMYLNSTTNLAIFLFKPIGSDIIRYFRHKCKNNYKVDIGNGDSNSNSTKTKSEKFERCGTVYKRPFLKWKNMNHNGKIIIN